MLGIASLPAGRCCLLNGKRPEYKKDDFFLSVNQTFYLEKELKSQQSGQKNEMLGPNHDSALDCVPWDLSSNVCRRD